MEPIFIIMSTLVGTVAGCVAGVILAQRFSRRPAAEAASLRVQLQASEAGLAAAAANMEALRKQVSERDQTLQTRGEELRKAALEDAAGGRVSDSDPSRELAIRAAALIEQCSVVETRNREERDRMAEEANRQKAALEAQVETERRRAFEVGEQLARAAAESSENKALEAQLAAAGERIDGLTADLSRVAAEAAEQRQASAAAGAQRDEVEAQLGVERDRSRELAGQLARLTAESGSAVSGRASLEKELSAEHARAEELTGRLAGVKAELEAACADASALEAKLASERDHGNELNAQLGLKTVEAADFRQSTEQGVEKRAELESQLANERQRNDELLKQVTDLNTEVAHLESRLEEERQSAANGMKLLSMAQDNLNRVFKALAVDVQVGSNGHTVAEAAVPAPQVKAAEEKRPVPA